MSLSPSWSESNTSKVGGYASSTSELVQSLKGFVSGSFKISSCDRSIALLLLHGCPSLRQWIVSSQGCGVYSRAAFINILALRCGVYLRAAFIRGNTVPASVCIHFIHQRDVDTCLPSSFAFLGRPFAVNPLPSFLPKCPKTFRQAGR